MSEEAAIRVLVVEDDPVIAGAHRLFVERVPGFEVAAVANSGTDALRLLSSQEVDLVLLDVYLPDMTGLDVCRTLRARGDAVDVIAVTSARDLATVRSAVSLGIVQYLIKPFQFAAFRGKLEAYADYRRAARGADSLALGQSDLDRMLDGLRSARRGGLPKGLSDATLARVVEVLRPGAPMTAADLAERLGISVPTARRYLEYLAGRSLVVGRPQYGGPGRPETVFRWGG